MPEKNSCLDVQIRNFRRALTAIVQVVNANIDGFV